VGMQTYSLLRVRPQGTSSKHMRAHPKDVTRGRQRLRNGDVLRVEQRGRGRGHHNCDDGAPALSEQGDTIAPAGAAPAGAAPAAQGQEYYTRPLNHSFRCRLFISTTGSLSWVGHSDSFTVGFEVYA
jgi:hypothetical protein